MRYERGDTIIEVMFAFVIFSMVVVGSIMLMNRGVAMAQRSLEVTQVRSQLDAQIDMARYLQRYDPDAWNTLIATRSISNIPAFSDLVSAASPTCPQPAALSGAFFFARRYDATLSNTAGGTGAYTVTAYPVSTSNLFRVDGVPAYSHVVHAPVPPDTPRSYGIWAQVTLAETNNSGPASVRAYDLHVRACWDSIGTSIPLTVGTVTRLYHAQ